MLEEAVVAGMGSEHAKACGENVWYLATERSLDLAPSSPRTDGCCGWAKLPKVKGTASTSEICDADGLISGEGGSGVIPAPDDSADGSIGKAGMLKDDGCNYTAMPGNGR